MDPRSDQEINPEYYIEVDNELRIKYRNYMGVDPDDATFRQFTTEQQIERYARNLSFWIIEQNSVTLESSGKEFARNFFISNNYAELVKKIKSKFNKNDEKKIRTRCLELTRMNSHTKTLDKIRNELKQKYKTAAKLYKIAKEEIELDGKTFDINPDIWLINQNTLRNGWEKFNSGLENSPLKHIMLNNSYSNYTKYMYDNYPAGFGDQIKKYTNLGYSDGAEIYYNLTH